MSEARLSSSLSIRSYQETIFAQVHRRNSLVVLPTGLGKTIIALMVALYHRNQTGRKVLMLAPTKPLVEQHAASFQDLMDNADDFSFTVLTGQVGPQQRERLYEEADFFFATPQLIENDLINGRLPLSAFSSLIFDECHRATGNYAYTFIAEQFSNHSVHLLGLTASPGSSREEIYGIMQTLRMEHLEFRRFDDSDVAPYVQEVEIHRERVAFPEEFRSVLKELKKVYEHRIRQLQETTGALRGKPVNRVTKKDLLDLQQELRNAISRNELGEQGWQAISLAAGLMKLSYGMELLETQDLRAAQKYFHQLIAGRDTSKAVRELQIDQGFRNACEEISRLYGEGRKHPKLIKVREIAENLFVKDMELRLIIFTQYRETGQSIVEELNRCAGISAVLFVGQNRKGESGMSQKQQKAVLESFREGTYNVLVSTSVGEEGLDIPKVDHVIFYEPLPSAIRTIQRAGRTGRFKKGKVTILLTEDSRDVTTGYVASTKERKMYKTLSEIREELSDKTKNGGGPRLTDFLKHTEEAEQEEEVAQKDLPRILVDSRENGVLIKELYRLPLHIETKNLEIGDIVITEHIVIERKSKQDFLSSLLEKRLFSQLLDLVKNYRRPVLILEGEEDIYALRNLNPGAIRAAMATIASDLRLPIIYTSSHRETAQMILTMVQRAHRARSEISLSGEKRVLDRDQEMERFVSSIPKINVVTAKQLLSEFSTLRDLVNASEDDLMRCQGLGRKRAKALAEFFTRCYDFEE